MTERVTLSILGVLALIAVAAACLGYALNAPEPALDLMKHIAIGLVGALGGFALAKSKGEA